MSDMLRIGIVCYPTYGGSGVVATELARLLAKRGHSVHIIAFDRPFRFHSDGLEGNLFFDQIDTVKYPVMRSELYTLSTSVKMAHLIEDEKLDILHSHYAVPHAVSAMLARQLAPKSNVRLVTTLHGTDITLVGSHPAFAPVVRMGLAYSDAVVSVSNWLREETHRRFGICRRGCSVIYNFVDPETVVSRSSGRCCSRKWFARDDQKILLHISNFRPVKRVTDVIRVFAKVAERVDSVLLMVGDGPDRDAADQMAHELGVHDRVRFLGLQDNVAGLLATADLFVFPSEYESFGLAVLEAMAAQVPVVCSNGGGLPEVMLEGVTGHMCPVADVETMALRAIEILRNPDRARAMGEAGRDRALRDFHPDRALDAYETLYENLLRQPPSNAAPR